jgi:hypothetical protein
VAFFSALLLAERLEHLVDSMVLIFLAGAGAGKDSRTLDRL